MNHLSLERQAPVAFPLSRGKPRRGRLSGRAIGPPVWSLPALSERSQTRSFGQPRKGRHHVAADPTGRERRPAPACPPPPSVIDVRPGGVMGAQYTQCKPPWIRVSRVGG